MRARILMLTTAILSLAVLAAAPARAQQFEAAPAPGQSWNGAPESAQWSAFAADAIDAHAPGLLTSTPGDAATFCPAYASLGGEERRQFWIGFLAALAHAESSDDPTRVHWRVYDHDVNRPTFRRGLFQIAIESAHRDAYACEDAHSADLADPKGNIECAVRILNRKIADENALAQDAKGHVAGAAEYWPTLRDDETRAAIRQQTAQLDVCRAG